MTYLMIFDLKKAKACNKNKLEEKYNDEFYNGYHNMEIPTYSSVYEELECYEKTNERFDKRTHKIVKKTTGVYHLTVDICYGIHYVISKFLDKKLDADEYHYKLNYNKVIEQHAKKCKYCSISLEIYYENYNTKKIYKIYDETYETLTFIECYDFYHPRYEEHLEEQGSYVGPIINSIADEFEIKENEDDDSCEVFFGYEWLKFTKNKVYIKCKIEYTFMLLIINKIKNTEEQKKNFLPTEIWNLIYFDYFNNNNP